MPLLNMITMHFNLIEAIVLGLVLYAFTQFLVHIINNNK